MSLVRHVTVRGRVQGVGFRAWLEAMAEERCLEGWVRNRRDGSVEAVLIGPEDAVNAVIDAIRKGPPGSKVESVDMIEADPGLLQQRAPRTRFAVLPTA